MESIESNSVNEVMQIPICSCSINCASAAPFHIIIGSPQRIYNEVLCGLLYFRYSPQLPVHPSNDSPSHTKPKSA